MLCKRVVPKALSHVHGMLDVSHVKQCTVNVGDTCSQALCKRIGRSINEREENDMKTQGD